MTTTLLMVYCSSCTRWQGTVGRHCFHCGQPLKHMESYLILHGCLLWSSRICLHPLLVTMLKSIVFILPW